MIAWFNPRNWPAFLRTAFFSLVLVVILWPELSTLPGRTYTDDELMMISIIITSLVIGILFIYLRIIGISRHYAGVMFDLDDESAGLFTTAIMNQIFPPRMTHFMLKVHNGRLDPESSAITKKIGGPGYVSIESNHIVVTSRFGELYRSLGAGFHQLHPFEKVWDVIDLRPQYRELSLDFMTADGIPARCKANITFRVAAPWQQNAFRLATGKYVKSASGRNRISDWTNGIAGGAFDGDIRNTLEQYTIDEIVNPLLLYPSANVNLPNPAPPVSLTVLEDQIRKTVVKTGEERGIDVTHIELSDVRPAEAVLQAWQKLWEANTLYMPRVQMAEQDAVQSQKALNRYALQRARLLQILGARADQLTPQGYEVLSDLIDSGILDAVFALDEDSPELKRALLP